MKEIASFEVWQIGRWQSPVLFPPLALEWERGQGGAGGQEGQICFCDCATLQLPCPQTALLDFPIVLVVLYNDLFSSTYQ
jgi:hypothetical protein